MADTVYVNGVDLSTYLTPISLLSGFIAPPPAVGSDYQIPGYIGVIPTNLGRGPRVVTVGGLISGITLLGPYVPKDVELARDAYLDKLEAFANAIYQNGNTFNLTWETDARSYSTLARHQSGPEASDVTPYMGRVVAEFLLLNPYWT